MGTGGEGSGQSSGGGFDLLGLLGGGISGIIGGIGDWFNYQRQEQVRKEQMEREDTAVQRRVADLKAAGINPVLAAGQAATTQQTVTPQFKGTDRVADSIDTSAKLLQMQQLHAGIAQTQAQTDYIRAQKNQKEVETSWMQEVNPLKKRSLELSNQFDAESIVSRVNQEAAKLSLQEKEATLKELLTQLRQKDIDYYDVQAVSQVIDRIAGTITKSKQWGKIDSDIAKANALIDLYKTQQEHYRTSDAIARSRLKYDVFKDRGSPAPKSPTLSDDLRGFWDYLTH